MFKWGDPQADIVTVCQFCQDELAKVFYEKLVRVQVFEPNKTAKHAIPSVCNLLKMMTLKKVEWYCHYFWLITFHELSTDLSQEMILRIKCQEFAYTIYFSIIACQDLYFIFPVLFWLLLVLLLNFALLFHHHDCPNLLLGTPSINHIWEPNFL